MNPETPPSRADQLRAMRATLLGLTQEQVNSIAWLLHGVIEGPHAWTKDALLAEYDRLIAWAEANP